MTWKRTNYLHHWLFWTNQTIFPNKHSRFPNHLSGCPETACLSLSCSAWSDRGNNPSGRISAKTNWIKSKDNYVDDCCPTNASANACSASVEACRILAAMTGRDAGLSGGLSQTVLDRNLPKLESLDGLVSLDASLEPAVDRGMPEDILLGLGDSCSFPRLYM